MNVIVDVDTKADVVFMACYCKDYNPCVIVVIEALILRFFT